MRGIAAISVVIFHFMEIAIPDYNNNIVAHAYLAVDFFFCLSGFVVAYAYDGRLRELGVWTFFKLRLIRLHPLVILMAVVGLIAFIADPFSNIWRKYQGELVLLFGSSSLMVPYPVVTERYSNLFHLNPPIWSLFWEYVANIFYALVLIRIRNWLLWFLVALSACWLFYVARRFGNLSIGWGDSTFIGGVPRVAFSFMAGVLVFRLRWIVRTRFGVAVPLLLLVLMLLSPYTKYNPVVEPLIVIFAFPFLIALGAGTNARGTAAKICDRLGEISYPVYMIHYPFIWIFMSYVEKYKPTLQMMVSITTVATVLLVMLSWLVLKWVDEPIRRYLKKRLVLTR